MKQSVTLADVISWWNLYEYEKTLHNILQHVISSNAECFTCLWCCVPLHAIEMFFLFFLKMSQMAFYEFKIKNISSLLLGVDILNIHFIHACDAGLCQWKFYQFLQFKTGLHFAAIEFNSHITGMLLFHYGVTLKHEKSIILWFYFKLQIISIKYGFSIKYFTISTAGSMW